MAIKENHPGWTILAHAVNGILLLTFLYLFASKFDQTELMVWGSAIVSGAAVGQGIKAIARRFK